MKLDGEDRTHESWGVVRLARVSGARRLFRSPVISHAYMELTIHRARVYGREDGEVHLMEGEQLVKVSLSAVQFAELLTTVNITPGVPCTIGRYAGRRVEDPPDEVDDLEVVVDAAPENTFGESRKLLDAVVAGLRDELARPGGPRKKQIESALRAAETARNRVGNDLEFYRKELADKARGLRTTLKGEMVATAELVLRSMGMAALADRARELAPDLPARPALDVEPVPTSPLPCGCHCEGGCGDPYAACMHPCREHTPL